MQQTHHSPDQALAHNRGPWLTSRGCRVAWVALVAFTPLAGHAAAIYGQTSDTEVRSDGVVSATTGTTLLPGGSGSPVLDRSVVYVIQLPSLGAVANPFNTATLRFNLASKTGTPPNVDLYGLGRRASSTVLASDYYGQTATADASDATLLQDNVLISTTANGLISTNSTGSTALKNYLNAQYASGAGAGQYVFLRLSSDSVSATVKHYTLTSADGGTSSTDPQIIYTLASLSYTRPFIWVRNSEKAGILAKIAANPWATSIYNGIISRVAADVAAHQSNRDTFLRALPIVDWAAATPKFKTIPAYAESTVRYPAEAKYNDALDCAVLYYLTGEQKYAQCAADILHNAVKTLLPVTASSSTGNGGWIFQSDLLKEARVTGTQLPIIYDFLYSWLQTNQVYDVKTAAMVSFNFTSGQSVFRKQYELTRDHGQKESNWSALMATMMLNNLLALDSSAERNTALQIYLTTGTSRQASLQYDYRYYTQAGSIWPESLQYSGAVGSIRSTHMVLLERVDPTLNLFDAYPNLPLSLPRASYLRFPNGEQVMFGDGPRAGTNGPFFSYELVYQHALARGRTDLTSFFGSLINGGVADGNYNRSTLDSYSTLGTQTEPLQLLWQAASLSEPAVTPILPRTDKLPHAGILLQRNPAPANNATYGLMGFIGGAAHIHSHASGMSMELFGMGEVLGAKSGTESYGSTINENHYRLFASNNTIIVNGASRGEGGWGGFGMNTVQTVSMEPQAFANAISPNYSFTTSSFADTMGTQAEGTQQRTLAIIRTSPTSGYYVDVFRSKSTVTNRTVTTLNGNVTNQYHDYIYRNFGENSVNLRADGVTLPLTSQPSRFQNDIGDVNEQPGWRYFTNTTVSFPTSQSIRAQFVATVSGTARYMDMHMPAVASREYAKVDSPEILEAPSPYNSRVAPTLVVRQIGEAWNKAFATVYEPHFGIADSTVQNVTQLVRSGIVVGVKVESTVAGKNLVQYIFSNPAAGETYTDVPSGVSFTGRFGVASNNGDGTTTLYLGEGSAIAYRGNSIATTSGSSSQAEVRFNPGQPPVVTTNTPLTVIAAPLPPGGTWVPTAGGTYDWTSAANWSPSIPNTIGSIAYQNINLAGDQTVNVNTPVTLGDLVVGDSSGSQNTTLQKNTSGSFIFDQTDNGIAYLTRTADGTGNVTFNSDLNITLNDNLTVRQAGGSAASTMTIAGAISGTGKDLNKEGAGLTLALTGPNTYSGATRVIDGILSLDHSQAIQNSALDALSSVAGNASSGLKTSLTALTLGGLTGDKALASLFATTSGGYTGVAALTLNPGTGTTPSYSGVIADGAAGMTLTKTGSGTQILAGANTYTGGTTLAASSGTLEIGATGTLGNGAYAGTISIGSGSTLKYSSSSAQTLAGSISGSGSLLKNTGSSTLTLGGSNTSFTGSITLNSGVLTLGNTNAVSAASALTLSGTSSLRTSVQNATVNAPITVTGTPAIHAPDFGTGSTTSTLTLGGAISGSGSLTLSSLSTVASNSSQTIRLNAQSSYTGSTTLNPAENDTNLIVKLGITNALPTTSVLSLNGVAGGGSGRSTKFDLSGFNQTIAGLQNTVVSLRSQQILNSGAAASLTINNTTAHSFSGNLNGTNLSLAKTGPGTQTLAGVNTMTGTTTINEGKLLATVGGSSASSSVILNNALATLGVSITDSTKTWTCAALTSSAAGKLEFDFGTIQPGTIKPLTVTGLANFSSTPTVRIVSNNGLAAGTYPLMSWGSISGAAPTVVSVVKPNDTNGLVDGTTASLTVTGNTLNLVIVGVAVSVKANNTTNLNVPGSWVGNVLPGTTATTQWNSTVTAANTTVLGADLTWAGISISDPTGTVTINAGHTLTLGANATDIAMSNAASNLTLNCPLILGDENVWNIANLRTLTIGGVISGAFPITKEGPGTTVLSGANTHTGDTILTPDSGIFEIGGTGNLGTGTYAAAIDIGSGSTFKYSSSVGQTLSGILSGSGTLNKTTSTSSTLTLSGVNTPFTGSITINSGNLSLGNANALGSATSITLSGGTTLTTQTTGITTTAPITLGAAASTTAISFGRSTSAQGSFTVNSLISGSGNLTLTTPNVNSGGNLQTIFLGAENTYGGTTLITTGNGGNTLSVRAGSPNTLPATTVLNLTGGNGSGSGRTVTFDLNGYDQTLSGLTNTISTLTARNQRITNTSTELAILTINNTADFIFGGTGISSTFNGNPVNPTAQITGNLEINKTGTAKFTLAPGAGNTFTGATTVLAGILSVGHPTSLQNSPLDTLNNVIGDAANGLQTTVTTLTLGGLSGDKNLAAIFTTTSGGYSGITALTLNPGTGFTQEYSGIIANGAAAMTLTKTGAGTQILVGQNTYTGATTINTGTLSMGANDVIADLSNVIIGNATLDAATFTDTVGTLDVTSIAKINLDAAAALAFANSSAIDWTGGTLNLTGTFVSGASLRFGINNTGLTPTQLASISATGFANFALNSSGFLTAASGYTTWQTTNSTAQTLDLDHDNDGVKNGIEYFLGGTTNTSGFTPLPGVTNNLGTLSVTWTKHATYIGTYGTEFVVETSANLSGEWESETLGITVTVTGNDVKYTFPTGTQNFVRLKVTP